MPKTCIFVSGITVTLLIFFQLKSLSTSAYFGDLALLLFFMNQLLSQYIFIHKIWYNIWNMFFNSQINSIIDRFSYIWTAPIRVYVPYCSCSLGYDNITKIWLPLHDSRQLALSEVKCNVFCGLVVGWRVSVIHRGSIHLAIFLSTWATWRNWELTTAAFGILVSVVLIKTLPTALPTNVRYQYRIFFNCHTTTPTARS